MKKLLLSLTVFAGFTATAQVDTLSEFFTGTPTLYGADPAAGGGYVTGNNGYGDLEKGMRFNNANGVTGGGSLTSVLAWIPLTINTSGTATVTAKVYTFNSVTAFGTLLGSQSLNLSAIDTTLAGVQTANNRPFNAVFNFASAITLPASNDILVMIELPTTTGDTVAIVSNTSGDWANAATHTFEKWSNNSLNEFATAWQGDVNVAMAIYPVINFTSSIEENVASASVYPNPANDVINFEVSEEIASIVITSLEGKVITTTTNTTLNVSDFNTGMYLYTLNTVSGKVANGSFTKN
jgi:hypothetical protein